MSGSVLLLYNKYCRHGNLLWYCSNTTDTKKHSKKWKTNTLYLQILPLSGLAGGPLPSAQTPHSTQGERDKAALNDTIAHIFRWATRATPAILTTTLKLIGDRWAELSELPQLNCLVTGEHHYRAGAAAVRRFLTEICAATQFHSTAFQFTVTSPILNTDFYLVWISIVWRW